MKTLFTIAFRNLFRQKRRNVLLGMAIAIGTLVLMLANSFSHGISRTLINEVVSYVAGHASVGYSHKGQLMSQVMRGGAHWQAEIEKLPGVKRVDPTLGVMARVIGSGRSDNAFVVGINMRANFTKEDSIKTANNFPMTAGRWESLLDTTIENPLILSVEKAKYLNVKMGDVVRIRLQDFDGSFQAMRLTVVGLTRPSNMFMEAAIYVEYRDIARMMGLRPEDSPYFHLTLNDPARDAVRIADSIWTMMAPPLAYMDGQLMAKDTARKVSALVTGYHADSVSIKAFKARVEPIQGDTALAFSKKAALFPKPLADSLGVKEGDTVTYRYPLRYHNAQYGDTHEFRIVVGGIYNPRDSIPAGLVLMHEVPFYERFYDALPKEDGKKLALDSASTWFKALTTEWIRLPRPRSTDEMTTLQREIGQHKYKGTTLTINTMYESASAVLKLEAALQIITLSAVMVIFFIILIGVVNTLRMTVRERTREIGTLRAIGMQSGEIRMVFLMETGLLAFFAAVTGTILAFLTMWGLGSIPINTAGNPLGILLVNGHLVFAPTVLAVSFFIFLIVAIAVVTAWFPASRAAKLPAATAMRHYE